MGASPQEALTVVNRCPALRNYTPQQLAKAAKELRGLRSQDAAAVSPNMIADYRLLRDQCRAFGQ